MEIYCIFLIVKNMQEILRTSKTAVFAFLEFVIKWSRSTLNLITAKINIKPWSYKSKRRNTQLTFGKPALPLYIIGLMEFRFGFAHLTGGFFLSFSVHHSGILFTKAATKGTMSEGNRGWICSLHDSLLSSSHSSNKIIIW